MKKIVIQSFKELHKHSEEESMSQYSSHWSVCTTLQMTLQGTLANILGGQM